MIGNSKKSAGFTLAEMLVTVGIFTIAITVSSSVFLNINNLQQQTANLEKLQNEGRYIMERMAKDIRARELDYVQTVPGEGGLTDRLIFQKDEFGEILEYSYDAAAKKIIINSTDAANSNVKSADLNSSSVLVESAKFIITPQTDQITTQPRVTMLITIKNNAADKYQKTLTLQSTVSSQVYR